MPIKNLQVDLIDLLKPELNKFYRGDQGSAIELLRKNKLQNIAGEFALARLSEDAFVGARTIGVPARIACQVISDKHYRIFISHTIREIRDAWGIGVPPEIRWLKPFDSTYTEMLPAFYRVEISLKELRARQYKWFLKGPEHASYKNLLPADIKVASGQYVRIVREVVQDQLRLIPKNEPIGVALSGGADSSLVAAVLLSELKKERMSNKIFCLTLSIDGGGTDLGQAKEVFICLQKNFGEQINFYPLFVPSYFNLPQLQKQAAMVLEEYHSRDVECGMAALLFHEAIKEEAKNSSLPALCFCFDGDGGNEIFRDYPLSDEGYGLISAEDVYQDPFLFLLGYERSKLAFNPVFSSGLSRAYTRTFNPGREFSVRGFSPLIDRRLVDFSQRLPLRQIAPTPEELHSLRTKVVRTGIKEVLGINLPVFPKTRFQEGCADNPKLLRVTQEDSILLKRIVLN